MGWGGGGGGMCFFFQAEDGIRDSPVTGVQTCALPIFELTSLLLVIAVIGAVVLARKPKETQSAVAEELGDN